MRIANRAIIAAVIFTLVGCIVPMRRSSGREIDIAFVKSIVKGTTTADEVRAKLGPPSSITETPDLQVWSYSHWAGKPAMFGTGYESSSTQMLTIQIRNGKVVDYSLSTSGR